MLEPILNGAAAHLLPDGRKLWLLPDRAAWLAEAQTLFVADLHLGKAASFRSLGVPVPEGTTAQNLQRLTDLLRQTQAQHLVFLGDFLHSAHGRKAALLEQAALWRAQHAGVAMTLVRGNHDDRAGDPPKDLNIHVVDEPWMHAGLALCHHPDTPCTAFRLAGHVHPACRIGGHDGLRLPAAIFDSGGGVLPAFGEFTGGFLVPAATGQSRYVFGPGVVRRLPR